MNKNSKVAQESEEVARDENGDEIEKDSDATDDGTAKEDDRKTDEEDEDAEKGAVGMLETQELFDFLAQIVESTTEKAVTACLIAQSGAIGDEVVKAITTSDAVKSTIRSITGGRITESFLSFGDGLNEMRALVEKAASLSDTIAKGIETMSALSTGDLTKSAAADDLAARLTPAPKEVVSEEVLEKGNPYQPKPGENKYATGHGLIEKAKTIQVRTGKTVPGLMNAISEQASGQFSDGVLGTLAKGVEAMDTL